MIPKARNTCGAEPRTPSLRAGRICLAAVMFYIVIAQSLQPLASPAISKDGTNFIHIAKMMRQSPRAAIVEPDQHPAFPAMLVVGERIARIFGARDAVESWIIAGRVIGAAFCLITVALAWLLARRLFDEFTAGAAAIFFVAMPFLLHTANDVIADIPHLCFYLLAIWLACEGAAREKIIWFLGAGAASGAAYWVRPEGLGAAMAIAVALTAGVIFSRKRGFMALSLALTLAAAVACATPYILFKGKVTTKKDVIGTVMRWISPNDARQVVAPENPEINAPAVPSPTSPPPSPAPPKRRGLLFVLWFIAARFVRVSSYGPIPFLLIGMLAPWSACAKKWPKYIVASAVGLHLCLVFIGYHTSGYISPRHMMEVVALSTPWMAAGFIFCVNLPWRLRARLRTAETAGVSAENALIRPGITLAALTLLAAITVPFVFRPQNTAHIPITRAGEWLRAQSARDAKILANDNYVGFYSGARIELIKDLRVLAEKALLAPRNYDYVVIYWDSAAGRAADAAIMAELKSSFEMVFENQGKKSRGICVLCPRERQG